MLNTDYRTYKILIFTSPVCAGLIIAMAKYDDEYRVFIDKAICDQAITDAIRERIQAQEMAIKQARARAAAEAIARKTAEDKIAAEVYATKLAEERVALDRQLEKEASELAEMETRLIESRKKQAEAIQQAKSAAKLRIETELKLTELATAIAQNQIIATAKAEERLYAAETVAAAVLHKIQTEASALMAIQARMEQDALAVERAIAREAVETMAIEAARARIQADETAIALASRKIREEIETTRMIQDNFAAATSPDIAADGNENAFSLTSDNSKPILTDGEEDMETEEPAESIESDNTPGCAAEQDEAEIPLEKPEIIVVA